MRGVRLLVLADLVVDRFLYGTPQRISREAPVLILQHDSERRVAGGGANAVANVHALGGVAQVLGRVGADREGDALLELLAEQGAETSDVERCSDWPTPTKVRILGGAPHTVKQQIVRYDTGSPRPLDDAELERLRARLDEAAEPLRQTDRPAVAILSDYGYGVVDPRLVGPLRQSLGPRGRILVDSRYRLAEFRGLDGATPNQEEAETILGASLEGREDLLTGGRRLLERLGGSFLLITRGSDGMALFERRGEEPTAIACLPAFGTTQVADVTGAGDTVIGAFALATAAGASPLEAAILANCAGSVVVSKAGTATASTRELRAVLESGYASLSHVELEPSPRAQRGHRG
jgi:rfaE bifunctional protein kinase chain/domain